MSALEEVFERRVRIIKVGGSLFTLSDLKDRLLQWWETIADNDWINIWVPGGGPMVDEIRIWQSRHGLNPLTAHRLSVETLSLTANLFHDLFHRWPLENNFKALSRYQGGPSNSIIFDCSDWAIQCERLGQSWATTSDSIALHLASEMAADHLVLLKSTSPVTADLATNRQQGVVDENFGRNCVDPRQPKISIVNLRQSVRMIDLDW